MYKSSQSFPGDPNPRSCLSHARARHIFNMTRSCSLQHSGYGAIHLFLSLGSNGFGVGLGERLNITLLAVL